MADTKIRLHLHRPGREGEPAPKEELSAAFDSELDCFSKNLESDTSVDWRFSGALTQRERSLLRSFLIHLHKQHEVA